MWSRSRDNRPGTSPGRKCQQHHGTPRGTSRGGRSGGGRGGTQPARHTHALQLSGRRTGYYTRGRPTRGSDPGRGVGHRHGALWQRQSSGRLDGRGTWAMTQVSGKSARGKPAKAIASYIPTALTQLAHAAAGAKETYLSTLYQRLAARRGRKRAIIAVAHTMVVSAFERSPGRH
jgi:hypothetical protein